MKHSAGERWRFIFAQAARLRDEATPEELMLADALAGGRDAVISGKSIGYLQNGWYFQWPAQIKGPRGKWWDVIFDFIHVPTLLVVELDGRGHKAGPDVRRDRACEFNRMKVLRFKNPRIRNDLKSVMDEMNAVRKQLEAAREERQ